MGTHIADSIGVTDLQPICDDKSSVNVDVGVRRYPKNAPFLHIALILKHARKSLCLANPIIYRRSSLFHTFLFKLVLDIFEDFSVGGNYIRQQTDH